MCRIVIRSLTELAEDDTDDTIDETRFDLAKSIAREIIQVWQLFE